MLLVFVNETATIVDRIKVPYYLCPMAEITYCNKNDFSLGHSSMVMLVVHMNIGHFMVCINMAWGHRVTQF